MHRSERWLRPVGEAKTVTLAHTLGDVETRILVETLALNLEVVAEALVHTVPHTLADAEGRHYKIHKAGCRRKNYWTC